MKPFADLELSRRLEHAEARAGAAFVEARAAAGKESGACWISLAGAYAMFDGAGSPATQTFGLGLFDPISPEVLDAIEAFFFTRGADADHEISPLAQKDLWDLLIDRGYRPIEFTSVLYLEVAQYQKSSLSMGIEISRAAARDIPVWAATAARGWAEMGELTGLMEVVASSKCVIPFLATIDGRPVATAALNVQDDIALLAGGSTIPGARNRGAQRSLLQARLSHAADMGCRIAMMAAEPGSSSQRNAEREGFRIAYTRTKWRRKSV